MGPWSCWTFWSGCDLIALAFQLEPPVRFPALLMVVGSINCVGESPFFLLSRAGNILFTVYTCSVRFVFRNKENDHRCCHHLPLHVHLRPASRLHNKFGTRWVFCPFQRGPLESSDVGFPLVGSTRLAYSLKSRLEMEKKKRLYILPCALVCHWDRLNQSKPCLIRGAQEVFPRILIPYGKREKPCRQENIQAIEETRKKKKEKQSDNTRTISLKKKLGVRLDV